MRSAVRFSTVLISRLGPPKAYAALILFIPWPGMSTQLSRGIDTTAALCPSAASRAIIRTSLRSPEAAASAPVPVVGASERVSVPTSRKVSR